MAAYTKLMLSGSTDGRPIGIIATATPGTVIHTATSAAGLDSADEVYLWAGNVSASAVQIGVSFGVVTEPMQTVLVRVPGGFNGPIAVIPGIPVRNSLLVHATAATASVVNLFGFVNRISGQTS
jgi:hypothetical protein